MLTDLEKLRNEGFEKQGFYLSVYPGLVADNQDPEGLARLRISLPTISGKQVLEVWALPFGATFVQNAGLLVIPQIGDNVWVMFLQGDLQYPLWTYGAMPQEKKIKGTSLQDHLWQNEKGAKIALTEVVELAGSKQKAVLGESLKNLLSELLTALKNLTVICSSSGSPSSTPVNSTAFEQIGQKLEEILSQKVKLE